jgi:hypothetical protein
MKLGNNIRKLRIFCICYPLYYKDPSTTKHFAFRIKLNDLHLSWNHEVFDFLMSTGRRKNTWLYGFDPIFDFMIFTFWTVHTPSGVFECLPVSHFTRVRHNGSTRDPTRQNSTRDCTGECPVFTFFKCSHCTDECPSFTL